MSACKSCERLANRDRGEAALWDNIYRSAYWDVVHAYNSSYLGWLVLVLRRHAEAIDELTADEAGELGNLLRRVSLALKQQLGCSKTYVMQFAESAEHPHVHFHVVARMPEQAPEDRAYRIFRHLGVPLAQRCGEEELNQLARGLKAYLDTLK
ncbi:MAG: HIT family protein [Chloroflexi bacterium]|nr:HIT family protein [Chloroflexota bacterium]